MTPISRLNHRLRTVRAATRTWQKNKRLREKVSSNIKHVILFLDAIEEWRSLSDMEFALRTLCLAELNKLCSEETQKWKKRAKIKWCKLGDENSKFFHTMATYRFRKNKIKFFKMGNEEFFADADKLKIATDFYSELFA